MSVFHVFKQFDKSQFFRFFVDGRFHKKSKYNGWIGYENREKGSVQAMLNAFSFMVDNYQSSANLNANYLRQLHRVCMFNVDTSNQKSSPGDIRYENTGLPFFKKTTTLESIGELLEMRRDDETVMFHDHELKKTANELNANEIFQLLQKKGKVLYRGWFPNIDKVTRLALEGNLSLREFYQAKHSVQMLIVDKLEACLDKYHKTISLANNNDEKLKCIALLIRDLEILHPFSDGNCRAFACVLLNQLLTFHCFHPAILMNPNLDFEYSLDQWVDEIKSGMENTKILLKNPTEKIFDYSINEMPDEYQKQFLSMSTELQNKIRLYEELFLTPQRLQQYTSGKWLNADDTILYNGIGTHGSFLQGNLYFATSIDDWIKDGKNVSKELNRCIAKGVKGIVLDNSKYAKNLSIPILLVSDVMEAFNNTAKKNRQEANPKTVLITGTEGKTSIKFQLYHLLKQQTSVHAWLSSANTVIPIHKSLASLRPHDQIELNEVSVDANNEKTSFRSEVVNPDFCFFSNISTEHMHIHKSIKGVAKNKSFVVTGLRNEGKCIVNSAMPTFGLLISELKQRKEGIEIITFGMSANDQAQLLESYFDNKKLGWQIKARINNIEISYFLPIFQNHAPLMSVGILLMTDLLGFDVLKASRDYMNFEPYETMGQIYNIKKDNGYFLFYDQSRRASISGVRSAFNDIKNFNVKGRTIALFGSISSVKNNDWTQSYHKELADLINHSNISKLYTLGPNMEVVVDNLKDPTIFVKHSDDLDQLYEDLMCEIKADDLLFIQGYLRLRLEEIAKKVVSFDDSTFESTSIKDLLLDAPDLLYHKLLAVKTIETGSSNEEIKALVKFDNQDIESLRGSRITFRNLRKTLLINFFQSVNQVVTKNFQMKCINQAIQNSDYRTQVHNDEFCDHWFNNIDKIEGKPKKMLFGSFFDFGDKNYLLNILVGTTNLHVGILKYYRQDARYILEKMNEDDFNEIHQRYDHLLPDNVALVNRKWGHKWVTVDCGELIHLDRREMFTVCHDLLNSNLYQKIFFPFLSILKVAPRH